MPDIIAHRTIRPFRAEDTAFVRELGRKAFAAYSRDAGRSMLSMLGEPGTETLIAELGEVPAGFVVLHYEQLAHDFGPWLRPTAARVDAIAVEPDARGRGIGRRLLQCAEEAARSLSLSTGERNTGALRLFETAGFIPLASIERYYAGGQTAVLMHKPLP